MASDDKFLREKRITGGVRDDAASLADGEPGALRLNSNQELIVSIGGGTGAVSVQGDTAHDNADTGNPVKIGGTATASEASDVDEGDRVQASFTLAGRQRVDTDITRIGTNTVATTNINGSLAIGGTSADNDAHDGVYPISVGGKVSTADPSYSDSDKAEISFSEDGRIRVNTDIVEVGGNATATGGVNGTFITEGPTAESSADSTSYPIQVGGRVVQSISSLTNNDIQKILLDLYGRLRTRDASFDELSGGNRVESLNLDSSNHDYASIPWADVTDASGAGYYPSSAGLDIMDRAIKTWVVSARDGAWSFEVANDDDWVDVTASLRDEATDRTGYTSAHFSEPDSATVSWAVRYVNELGYRKARFYWDPNDATNIFEAQGFGRAM